ncbi:MAG: Gfo/Idh/MocA family oxidoreductase [Lachnospiraceae bacterium]|jgi:predicted dehydrogenase|nr:Gfo/Idh/MocA family oxidoreductase [Lachnospiraceae bacterium]
MYKIAIAGCGMVADEWIEAVKDRTNCTIRALVVAQNVDAAKEKAAKHSLSANVYLDLATAIEKEEISLVFDLTPPEYHFETVTTALKAGCDVFGEKPLAPTLAEAYAMVECAEATGREYFVMQNRRYIPELYALRDFLRSGSLGQIGQISANFQLAPRFGGFREQMDSPLIADMAIHTFDAARFLAGKNAVSVYCQEFNPVWSWYRGNANAVCIFEMEDGAIFDYRGSWCARGLETSWEAKWRITGEKGSAFWDGTVEAGYEWATERVTTGLSGDEEAAAVIMTIPKATMAKTKHAACIDEMFNALLSGTRPPTDCRDNIKSIEMVQKAIESARKGEKVKI